MSPGSTDLRTEIQNTATTPDRLHIDWGDGHRSEFHYAWLRDNCRCDICGDKSGGHRYLELNDIALDIVPHRISTEDKHRVDIEWMPGGHRSCFDASWLRAHCYSEVENAARRDTYQTWGNELEGA